jgi:unsaturated rhamnogalacturonyl hydrolase
MRDFPAAAMPSITSSAICRKRNEKMGYRTFALKTPPPVSAPSGKRFPFGGAAFVIPPNSTEAAPVLSGKGQSVPEGIARLRLTIALDDREEKTVETILAESGRRIGIFDLRYADMLQTFEILLAEGDGRAALHEGVRLQMMKGTTPLYVFGNGRGTLAQQLPHLLTVAGTKKSDPLKAFSDAFLTGGSLEAFGWHEGCVLDGLYDFSQRFPERNARATLDFHLDHFLIGKELVYENPRSEPSDGKIYGIEGTLPFAVIAKVRPDHPSLELALRFWKERREKQGAIMDGTTTTAEGCYTVAYPLAALSRVRKSEELAQMALHKIRVCHDRLPYQNAVYLRHNATNDTRTFRNWARGIAWYLLGTTRTLIELGERSDTADLREECRSIAKWAVSQQQSDGLWRCFLDDPTTYPEAFGSAGIGAALALGARHGILEPIYREAARKNLDGLIPYLTPDGLLTGGAQSNKGGEALQRSSYRVIKKTAMGLMAQLIAGLEA